MKKSKLYLLASFCLTSSVLFGCGKEKEELSTKHLTAVIENTFKNIDDAQYEQTEIPSTVPDWVYERFETHMTSEELENFLSTGTYQIAVLAYLNDKTIQIKDLSIDHKNDYYELCWTTQVKDIHANVEILQVEASAQLDTNGLVTYLNINDMFELQKILENQSP
ncbi:hypothetical protein [Blautia sp.]|uniref:hypothetical protein n=1 Tax=Blautia sp. TaxID=1955243 RepID=UPI0025C5FE94|nr:hypothetical protein [Blautia sp.]